MPDYSADRRERSRAATRRPYLVDRRGFSSSSRGRSGETITGPKGWVMERGEGVRGQSPSVACLAFVSRRGSVISSFCFCEVARVVVSEQTAF